MKPARPFEPMLAGTPRSDADIRFPVLASPKLDGVRGVVKDNALLSRSLKKIPNKWVQALMSMPELHGLDGELIVGPASAPNVMQATMSTVMSHDKTERFEFHVFDVHGVDDPFVKRLAGAAMMVEQVADDWLRLATMLRLDGAPAWIMECPLRVVPHQIIHNLETLATYEAEQLARGYEGVMVRDPAGLYKHGRSTTKEGGLLKLKRFTDGEFIITGFVEEMENTNEKTVNEKGRSKRSTHAAGKVGKGTLGAFTGRRIYVNGKSKFVSDGPEFNVGTGMDAAFRAWAWANKDKLLNQVGKFKHFEHGVVDAPRHPVWIGLRDKGDMS